MNHPNKMTAKEECECLIDEFLPFARQMLGEHGEFNPFGGYMRNDGTIVHASGHVTHIETPSATSVLAVLQSSFRTLANEGACKCTAIVFDVLVKLPENHMKVDAIQINLDHKDGFSKEVLFPYTISNNGQVEYLPIFAQKGENNVFASAQ